MCSAEPTLVAELLPAFDEQLDLSATTEPFAAQQFVLQLAVEDFAAHLIEQ